MSSLFVEVLLDRSLKTPLDYLVPPGKIVEIGMRVKVPLQNRFEEGIIVKIKEKSSFTSVKAIIEILSEKNEFSKELWQLAHWMKDYYQTPLQKVLKTFLPSAVKKKTQEKQQVFLTLKKSSAASLKKIHELRQKAPKQAEILEKLLSSSKGSFLKEINPSLSALKKLIEEGWIESQKLPSEEFLEEEEFFPTSAKTLNEEQRQAYNSIEASILKEAFQVHLIHGVTGSGKTEVYMQAIQKALDLGKSAMILVPEIALTSQTIERFRSRFSEKLAIFHHKRSSSQRAKAWKELKTNQMRLVIGARSALFAPVQNLGLIIIDEEHDSSYKQTDEMPCYHARDTAVMRAFFEKCPIILASATPSIESYQNAKVGKYQLHTLTSRATNASLPEVKMIDMKEVFSRNQGFTHFSEVLLDKIKERTEKGEQTLLLLNQRGYYRMQLCLECAHILKCPHCDLSLRFHKEDNLLRCHLCEFSQKAPRICPNCSKESTLQFKGFGTEHVQKSLHAIFPEIRTLRMDRDTTRKKQSHEEIFQQFRSHKADVLIGTQMIAKGFHFPQVTLVGILNPDLALHIPDFRAPENIFQLITQVAGRAGRAELKGEVYIQTSMPNHPTLKLAAKQDYLCFYKKEIEERKLFSYPPFSRFVKLLFRDKKEALALQKAEKAHAFLKSHLPKNVELFPVKEANQLKVKDFYRFQILIKTAKISFLSPYLKELKDVKIDVDPIFIA